MNIKNIVFAIFTVVVLSFIACDPDIDEKITLPAAPTEASFTVADQGDNTYLFTNTTDGGFLFQWDFGNGTKGSAEEEMVTYSKAGAYIVTLTVFNAGGHALGSQSLVVENDLVVVSEPCAAGTLAEYLSDCDQKTWRLNPAEGALLVAPADLSQTWWQNDASVVDERFCAWDDTWTFYGDGKLVYDTNGDIWGEDYLGFGNECVATTDMPDDVAAWGDGEHQYVAVEGTQQVQLNGVGAFMGIPKAANGSEVGFPVASVTYDVIERGTNTEGKDLLVLQVLYNTGTEDAIWRFTFVAE